MLNWTCHICGESRPDHLISVHSIVEDFHGAKLQKNVRYCNDREDCTEKAVTHDFFGSSRREEATSAKS